MEWVFIQQIADQLLKWDMTQRSFHDPISDRKEMKKYFQFCMWAPDYLKKNIYLHCCTFFQFLVGFFSGQQCIFDVFGAYIAWMGDRKLGPYRYTVEQYSYIALSEAGFLCFIWGEGFFGGIFHIRPLHCEKHLRILGG